MGTTIKLPSYNWHNFKSHSTNSTKKKYFFISFSQVQFVKENNLLLIIFFFYLNGKINQKYIFTTLTGKVPEFPKSSERFVLVCCG